MDTSIYISCKQASQLCSERGLARSTKSIRRWCANGDIVAQKRQASHGEKWFIDRNSLEIKIREELEFLNHFEVSVASLKGLAQDDKNTSTHDWTQVDVSAHERSQADMSKRDRTEPDRQNQQQIRDLEDQIMILENDIKWRSQLLRDQKNANTILMDEIKGQSRYIGHLETNVLRLGGKTDQTFLVAPVPKPEPSGHVEDEPEMVTPEVILNDQPHPDQSNLYTG